MTRKAPEFRGDRVDDRRVDAPGAADYDEFGICEGDHGRQDAADRCGEGSACFPGEGSGAVDGGQEGADIDGC